jgi:hypothetical protein
MEIAGATRLVAVVSLFRAMELARSVGMIFGGLTKTFARLVGARSVEAGTERMDVISQSTMCTSVIITRSI